MIYLNKEQIIQLHSLLIKRFGGRDGLRDESMLDAALFAPFHSFGSNEFYPSAFEKIVKLGYELIKSHPFLDGNKRIGLHIILILLSANGFKTIFPQNELIDAIFNTACGNFSEAQLLDFLKGGN